MAEINVEMLREKLYRVAKALFYIGETCVDASKSHISERDALDKIRKYLYDTDIIGSRLRVDQLIEDCAEPFVTNTFQEPNIDWLKEVLPEMPLQKLEVSFPSCCDGCSNNPKNGGSGICNCTLPYMQNPTTYTMPSEDCCMVNNTGVAVQYIERARRDITDQYISFNCPECNGNLEVYYDGPHSGDQDNLLIRHCKKCLCDWENEWHEDGSESQLRRKYWG